MSLIDWEDACSPAKSWFAELRTWTTAVSKPPDPIVLPATCSSKIGESIVTNTSPRHLLLVKLTPRRTSVCYLFGYLMLFGRRFCTRECI